MTDKYANSPRPWRVEQVRKTAPPNWYVLDVMGLVVPDVGGFWNRDAAMEWAMRNGPALLDVETHSSAPLPRGGKVLVEHIDLTPSWSSILPVLLIAYADGTPEGQSLARVELERMARLADLYVASRPYSTERYVK